MKKLFLLLLLLVVAVGIYWFFFRSKSGGDSGPKQAPLIAGRHSAAFNGSIDSMMTAYFNMKAAFVEADTVKAKEACKKMILLADSVKLEELKKDTTGIYESAFAQMGDVKSNAESLVKQTDITEMRKDFQMVSESLYPLLKAIHYEGSILYWQNCPMAFGEDKAANWISNTEEIVNPYLGKNHPEFKGTMLHCGEVKDSIKAQ